MRGEHVSLPVLYLPKQVKPFLLRSSRKIIGQFLILVIDKAVVL